MLNASIITIGDELLIGQVIDTNSAWIARELNKAGIRVKRRVAVADSWEEIWSALNEEAAQAEIILITGGLGPTADDITKPLLCEYFSGKLIVNEAALNNVRYLFEEVFKRPLTDRNFKQAEVPDVCTVIQNKRGTAPGMWFEKEGKIFMSMPGVPNEMQGMMSDDVIPKLAEKFKLSYITHRTLITFGIGESSIADLLPDFEAGLPANIKLAYLPNHGLVRLRLSASGDAAAPVNAAIEKESAKLKLIMREWMITDNDEPMEAIVANHLLAKNSTVSTAESCTGGYIAHLLTSIPGASAYFEGSVVSYSNKVKENLLGVDQQLIENDGAVSEAVVIEMMKAAIRSLETDYSVAVSGIMGPGGGSADKPVGTVWIAAGNKEKHLVQKFQFRFDRQRNIQLTAMNALNLLRKFILEN